jgi:hypothetical protein
MGQNAVYGLAHLGAKAQVEQRSIPEGRQADGLLLARSDTKPSVYGGLDLARKNAMNDARRRVCGMRLVGPGRLGAWGRSGSKTARAKGRAGGVLASIRARNASLLTLVACWYTPVPSVKLR